MLHRIEYKISMLVLKCLHNLAPQYLCDLIERYEPNRSLRSADKNMLVVKPGRRSIGDRARELDQKFGMNYQIGFAT